jgi:hypothetical protein
MVTVTHRCGVAYPENNPGAGDAVLSPPVKDFRPHREFMAGEAAFVRSV